MTYLWQGKPRMRHYTIVLWHGLTYSFALQKSFETLPR